MEEDRIPTEIWIAAQIRACTARGQAAYLARKGAVAGGMVMVKIIDLSRQCGVFTQNRDFDGNSGWLPAFDGARVDEREADAYISRATARDPDLWVLEVESRDGSLPFEGKVF